jgi:hypothetical protein
VVALAGRLVLVQVAWRRFRRRCDTGDLCERTTGSWPFARARLRVLGVSLPPDLSPDRAAGAAALQELPEQARGSLDQLAALVVTAGFSGRGVSRADHRTAWEQADRAAAAVRASLSPAGRLLAVLRRPQIRTRRL